MINIVDCIPSGLIWPMTEDKNRKKWQTFSISVSYSGIFFGLLDVNGNPITNWNRMHTQRTEYTKKKMAPVVYMQQKKNWTENCMVQLTMARALDRR